MRERVRMAQAPLNPTGGESQPITARLTPADTEWMESAMRRVEARTRSEFMRRLIAFARDHEEELLATAF